MSAQVHDEGAWFPLEPAQHEAQVRGVARLLEEAGGGTLIDLGAGDGRVARRVATEATPVVAIDVDESALSRCHGAHVRTIAGDFLDDPTWGTLVGSGAAGACCLGNTFVLVSDVERAAGLLSRVAAAVRPGGFFAIDNLCTDVWPEVGEGNWQSGVSEDGGMQLVWAPDDAVIALRRGGAIDEDDWCIGAGDTPMRLWGIGHLRLLAMAAGWEGPIVRAEDHLIVLRNPGSAGGERHL